MRHKLLEEHAVVSVLLHCGKTHHLSLLQVSVDANPSHYRLHAQVGGRKAGHIHHGAHGNRNARQNRNLGRRTNLRESDLIPNLMYPLIPVRSLAGRLEAIVRYSQIGLVSRFVQLRHILADHPTGIELMAESL